MGELERKILLLGVLLPAALAACVLALASRLPPGHRGLGGALALAVGVCTSYFALELGPLTPAQENHWLPYIAVLAIPAGWTAGWSRSFAQVALALTIPAFFAGYVLESHASTVRLLWSAVLAYAALLSGCGLIFGRVSAALSATAMALTSMVAGCVLLASGLSRMMQIAGMMFACAGSAALVIAVLERGADKPMARGLATGFAALLAGLMYSAYEGSSSDVSPTFYALIALTPAVLLLTRIPCFARLPAVVRVLLPLGSLALPLGYILYRVAPTLRQGFEQ